MKRRKYYIILIIPFLLIPFASSRPDGLEWVAEKLGFADAAYESTFLTPLLPDYTFPGIAHDGLSMVLAGILGAFLMFILGCGIARLLVGKTSR